MKAEQSAIYRSFERLNLWALKTFANAPKQPAVEADIRIVMENIAQAMSAVAVALDLPDGKQKHDLLDVVVYNITIIKSITKTFSEYSEDASGVRVISRKQRVPLIELITDISNQLGRWRNKVARALAASEPQNA